MNLLINLLPPQERCCPARLRRGGIIATMVWLAVLLSCYAYVSVQNGLLERRAAQAQQRSALLRCDELAMVSASEKQRAIRERNMILQELYSSRNSWLAVMMHLAEVVPEKVILTEVSLGEAKIIVIKGRAENTAEVLHFLQRLDQDAFFLKARLVAVGAGDKGLSGFKAFEITVSCKE